MREEIKNILSQLKMELEVKYKFEESKLSKVGPSILGATGIRMHFESQFSLIIYFWEHGIIDITCLYSKRKYWGLIEEIKEIMVYVYTPKDYQNKIYPQESFDILLEKIEELKKEYRKYTL
ncbi:hypothetical protein ACM40_06040 [Chryseobacterium sp. BLS98]|uniref:hypothetical protein n=1 Tax=Chryseobacterium sp. BLS98 TaxID=885586 RepID=UPI00065AA4B4|nr:hypothetical protein [Chryseobacterium sp. BLS98]KMQ61882.1 hypothetical protein ACM40_06040 [Chryseobacterium sp. BLS98]